MPKRTLLIILLILTCCEKLPQKRSIYVWQKEKYTPLTELAFQVEVRDTEDGFYRYYQIKDYQTIELLCLDKKELLFFSNIFGFTPENIKLIPVNSETVITSRFIKFKPMMTYKEIAVKKRKSAAGYFFSVTLSPGRYIFCLFRGTVPIGKACFGFEVK